MGDTSSSPAAAQAAHAMALLNVMVLALVVITAALTFLGSFAVNKAYTATGFLSAITTLLVYTGAVSYTISNSCQGQSSCISGPVGSTVTSGTVVSWGFEAGFYLLLIGGILALFAVIFHNMFLRPEQTLIRGITSKPIQFCSNCGHPLQTDAKFCSHCAHAVPTQLKLGS